MTAILTLWSKEPARIVGFVTAGLTLLVAFGVQLNNGQQVAILGFVSALLILAGAEVTRSIVSSPDTVAKQAAAVITLPVR